MLQFIILVVAFGVLAYGVKCLMDWFNAPTKKKNTKGKGKGR